MTGGSVLPDRTSLETHSETHPVLSRGRIYLTAEALHRPFDHAALRPDAEGVLFALELAVQGDTTLLFSYAHLLDIRSFGVTSNQFVMRLMEHYALMIAPSADIDALAASLHKDIGLTGYDSIHVACAAWRGATHFVTPSRALLRRDLDIRRVLGASLSFLAPDELPLPANILTNGGQCLDSLVITNTVVESARDTLRHGGGEGDWYLDSHRHMHVSLKEYEAQARHVWTARRPDAYTDRVI